MFSFDAVYFDKLILKIMFIFFQFQRNTSKIYRNQFKIKKLYFRKPPSALAVKDLQRELCIKIGFESHTTTRLILPYRITFTRAGGSGKHT